MSITYDNSIFQTVAESGGTVTYELTIGNNPNTYVLAGAFGLGNGTYEPISAATLGGNGMTSLISDQTGTNVGIWVFGASTSLSGIQNIVLTQSFQSPISYWVFAYSYYNVGGYDTSNATHSTGTSSPISTSITPNFNDCLVWSAVVANTTPNTDTITLTAGSNHQQSDGTVGNQITALCGDYGVISPASSQTVEASVTTGNLATDMGILSLYPFIPAGGAILLSMQ